MIKNDILFDKLIAKRTKLVEALMDYEARGVWHSVIGKYSSEAHFVNELLQNADDCNATSVTFNISKEGLIFKHNGTVQFSVSNIDNAEEDSKNGTLGHINAITGIGNTSKLNEQKIGKFGIGFKAVFAYTSTPEIYDDNFSFRLENYLIPVKIEANKYDRKKGETLFFFPFNNKDKPAERAYSEIVNKLKSLRTPLLFLSNLKEINWLSKDEKGGFKKTLLQGEILDGKIGFTSEIYSITTLLNNTRTPEKIWLFSKLVPGNSDDTFHKVSAGFRLSNTDKILTDQKHDAFCFFPTKESTNLRFLINAPFLLNDNRQNILAGEDWNGILIQNLAELAASALLYITKQSEKTGHQYFEKNFTEIIPYNHHDFSQPSNKDKISFFPFYDEIKSLLLENKILPARNGKFYSAEKAYWSTDNDLVDMFSDEQISELLENKNSGFVFPSIGQKNMRNTNPILALYLEDIVLDYIAPEDLIRKITAKFTQNQSVEWLVKFYEYLNERDSYKKTALDYPILLNQNRRAVVPFDKHRKIFKIFLPTESSSDFSTIHSDFIKIPSALEFFQNLGIKEPDIKALYLNKILPKYQSEELNIEDEDIIIHTKTLLEFYEKSNTDEFAVFIDNSKKLPLFCGVKNNAEKEEFLVSAEELYLKTENLLQYFEGEKSIFFLDEDFYKSFLAIEEYNKLLEILRLLHIATKPRIIEYDYTPSHEQLSSLHLDDYKWYSYKLIKDKNLDGLENVLEKITIEKSFVLWNFLLQNIGTSWSPFFGSNAFSGSFNFQKDGRYGIKTTSIESTLLKLIRYSEWLYDKDENLLSPSNITYQQLHDNYDLTSDKAETLKKILAMTDDEYDPELSDDQKEIYDLGKKIASLGLSEEEVMAALEELQKNKNQKPVISPVQEDLFPDDESEDDIPEVTEKKKKVKNTIKKITESLFDKISENFDEEKEISTQISKKEDEEDFEENVNYVPPINLEEEYQKRIEEVKRELEEIQLMEQLKNDIVAHEKYTFGWFKALMELEYRDSVELNNSGKDISISFGSAQMENDDSRMLILSKPVRPIPHSIEEHGDLLINLFIGNEIKQVSVEVVNVKEYTVRAKIRRVSEVRNIDFSKVTKAVIDIKNPIFLLEKLRSNLIGLDFELEDNLKEQLPENIEFIFGPPGTGKTTYLADQVIIPEMKKNQDLKILVLTPTNKAADVLSAKIMEKMQPDNSYLEWLIRFGLSGDAKVAEELGEDFKKIDIDDYNKATVISTIARFSYDFFLPEGSFQKNYLSEIQWDFVIIDEASMITLPNIVNVIYRQTQAKIIIAGDPFQISPISRVPEWQDENIYTMVNLNSFKEPQTEPHNFPIVKRETQYRSIPTVGKIFSVFTYDDLLQHHRTHEEQKVLKIDNVDFKALNVIKFPVAKFESIFKPNSLEGSKYHIYSALFTVELVLHIAKERMAKQEEFFRIGIICPYRAQSDIIERIISQEFTNNEFVEISVGTIHGFQGDECDAIFTIFNPPNYIKGNPDMFLNKHNILNVAISRARDYLFVLMPDDKTENVKKLQKINQIADLCFVYGGQNFAQFSSITIESKLFGSPSYIYDNSFATTHQKVNVYSKPVKKYELRCEEKAVDVQIKE